MGWILTIGERTALKIGLGEKIELVSVPPTGQSFACSTEGLVLEK